MKKIYFILSILLGFCLLLAGCSKDDPDEPDKELIQTHLPGKIPGLGKNGGTLTGNPFKLPDNIEVAGKIWGGYNPTPSRGVVKEKTFPILSKAIYTRAGNNLGINTTIGSGSYVSLYIILKNTSNRNIEVLFPVGLIAKSLSGNAQNGVLLKKTTTQVIANSSKAILLMMYCGNAERSASSMDEEYQFSVVSNSSLIIELGEKLKNKRINFEEYDMKSLEDLITDPNFDWENFDWESYYSSQYNEYISFVQDVLWKLTDYGEPISSEDISYINNMENSK